MKVPRWLENFPLGFGWEKADAEFSALMGVTHAANIVARVVPPEYTASYVDNIAAGERHIERCHTWISVLLWFVPWAVQYVLRGEAWAFFAYLAYSTLLVLFGVGPLFRAQYTAKLNLRARELTRLCNNAQATQDQLNAAARVLDMLGVESPWSENDPDKRP